MAASFRKGVWGQGGISPAEFLTKFATRNAAHGFLAGFSAHRLYWGLMKIQSLLGIVAAALIAPAFGQEIPKTLEIGSPAPDFSLPGIDGKTHTLADYKDSKVLCV